MRSEDIKYIDHNKVHTKRRLWTDEEDYFLEDNLNKLTNREMAERLNRSVKAIKTRLSLRGLRRNTVCERVYALYDGDDFIAIGSLKELAERTDKKIDTLRAYATRSGAKRMKKGYCLLLLEDD